MRTIMFYLSPLFFSLICIVLPPSVSLSFSSGSTGFYSSHDKTAYEASLLSITHALPSDYAPVILQTTLTSSNYNPLYATDNDILTLRFTTAVPCELPFDFSPREAATGEPLLLYYNPSGDHQTFYCTMRVRPELFSDQSVITPDTILSLLFPDGYRYYDYGSHITYLAPIRLSYQLAPVSEAAATYLLTISSNHPIELIALEKAAINGKALWSVSCIDAAANGPLCLTFFLEEEDVLLYNLVNEREQMIQEESYAGKSD